MLQKKKLKGWERIEREGSKETNLKAWDFSKKQFLKSNFKNGKENYFHSSIL